ncbi:hypothetical protein [Photorhabdus sp. RW14-46]|nr:hypothetical protein [Photorhabdus sp. RW14-46]
MTGVSECSQQRSNLKDDGYKYEEIYISCITSRDCVCRKRRQWSR